jgi:hypothetical protein
MSRPAKARLPDPTLLSVVGVLAVSLVLASGRVWIIRHYPEPDSDAQGHLGIASSLIAHPWSVSAHWVWPPGYHYLLAGLLALGVTAQGVRLLNCALAALLPVMVLGYTKDTLGEPSDGPRRAVPLIAALLCAVMPIVNLLGTSAQQATLFATLVVLGAWGIDSRRFPVAGAALACATLVRYEAWGAVALLAGLRLVGLAPRVVKRLPPGLARVCSMPSVVVVSPVVAIAGWLVAHRVADGTWLGFLRELYRFTHLQRQSYEQGFWKDLLWFPVEEPWFLFGLTLPLVLVGVRRAWRDGFVVPLGIYLFLLASYAGKGALGSARYYESLAPFVCIAAAHGASALGERWRPATALASLAALVHVLRLLVQTGRWTFHLAW